MNLPTDSGRPQMERGHGEGFRLKERDFDSGNSPCPFPKSSVPSNGFVLFVGLFGFGMAQALEQGQGGFSAKTTLFHLLLPFY
jgi:hypothetical protein